MKQLIIFALVCLPLLCACGGSQQKEADATYKTLTVTQSDQILKSDYTATLRGRQYVEIRPQVSGIITRICINEGDPVHKGQTLFIIDQVPYKAALETAVANVKSAEAKLATAKLTADSKAELYKEQIVSEFDLQTARNESQHLNRSCNDPVHLFSFHMYETHLSEHSGIPRNQSSQQEQPAR